MRIHINQKKIDFIIQKIKRYMFVRNRRCKAVTPSESVKIYGQWKNAVEK